MAKIKFLEWLLLIESQTIAQLLKNDKEIKSDPDYLKVINYINSKILSGVAPGSKYITTYVNFFFYNFYNKLTSVTVNNPYNKPYNKGFMRYAQPGALAQLGNQIDETIDYLVASGDNNILKSKLNNSQFTIEMLVKESEEWHERIETSKAKPAAEADTFINLSHLGSSWNGWRWVLLDKRSCEKEGASAGHCGNAAGKEGDNILSLRDPSNVAYLTFIINDGSLGEMKARNNSKPSIRFHPVIIELLKNNIVKTVKGGGYKPENNFSMDDLDESIKQNLYKLKPNLNYDLYIEQYFKKEIFELKNPREILTKIQEMFNDIFDSVVGDELVVDKFDSFKDFSERAKKYYAGDVEDLSFMDDHDPQIDNVSIKDVFDHISDENIEIIKKILNSEEQEYDEDEILDAIKRNRDLLSAVETAARRGYEDGAQADAWKRVTSSLSHKDENGFYAEVENAENIMVKIAISNLKDIYKEHAKDNYELREFIKIDYTHPYNGYEGFSKDYFNDYLGDELHQLS